MRVVIADDSVLVREGIVAILRRAGIDVAAQASDAAELQHAVDEHVPDAAIVDIRMPPTHTDEGLRAAAEIRARHPGIGIVILSQHVEVGTATRLLAESPERLGYLLKDRVGDIDEFAGTLRRVVAGGSALDPQIVSRLLAGDRQDGPLCSLTDARARGARARGGRALEQGHRRAPRGHRAGGAEARDLDLLQARPPGRRRRQPPHPGGARLPAAGLIRTARVPVPAPANACTPHVCTRSWLGPCWSPQTRSTNAVGSHPQRAAAHHHSPAAVVSARDVVRRYGEGDTAVAALRGVSVDIAEGRLTAVMGPSGSGKSTLMHILAGLDKPTSGEVSVAGVDISGLNDTELTKLRRDHIGFIFQFFNLLPMLTAAENIVLPLKLAGTKPNQAWLDEVVESVGLGNRLSHRPSELSGGQQQRVAVARALVSRPSVMFADEPTGNLDSTTSGEILTLLRDSVDTLGQTTVMVTHDAHAAAIADRVLFLADGDIVRDLGRSSAHEILETLEQVTGR